MTATTLLFKSQKELKKVSLNPYQESLWILANVLKISPNKLYTIAKDVSLKNKELFLEKIQLRKQGYPLEYILKEKFFFNKAFYVEEGAFIPRPETEILVEWLARNFHQKKFKALDFGAGVGTLCLSLLSVFPESYFVAVEQNLKAIKCLKKNSHRFQLEKRLSILKKDVLKITPEELEKKFNFLPSLIVANPPYIDPQDKSCSPEIDFEPATALFSDNKGLGHIVSWFKKAMSLLNSKGLYIFEIGWNQEKPVRAFLQEQRELFGFEIHKDKAGQSRMALCFKK